MKALLFGLLLCVGCSTTIPQQTHELELSYKTLLCSVTVKYKGEVR